MPTPTWFDDEATILLLDEAIVTTNTSFSISGSGTTSFLGNANNISTFTSDGFATATFYSGTTLGISGTATTSFLGNALVPSSLSSSGSATSNLITSSYAASTINSVSSATTNILGTSFHSATFTIQGSSQVSWSSTQISTFIISGTSIVVFLSTAISEWTEIPTDTGAWVSLTAEYEKGYGFGPYGIGPYGGIATWDEIEEETSVDEWISVN